MLIPQKQSTTSSIRQLCQEIQCEINIIIKKTSSQHQNLIRQGNELYRIQQQRLFQQLKNTIIQQLTSHLPFFIQYEQNMNDRLQDISQQRDSWIQKYKNIFKQYEQNQLQNDKLKIQIITLTQNYQQLSIIYQDIKYKYHQLQQKQYHKYQQQKINNNKFNQLKIISKDSPNNSLSSQRQQTSQQNKTIQQLMKYQKEMFLQQIRTSQKEIYSFRQKMQLLLQEKYQLEQQKQQLQHLLEGQKIRSDKLDRQIIQILNKNQELKIIVLEEKQRSLKVLQDYEQLKAILKNQQANKQALQTQINQLKAEIQRYRQQIIQIKGQFSQSREINSMLEQKQREYKMKISEMKKQNELLRCQIQKLILNLTQTKNTIQKTKQQEILKIKNELYELHNKTYTTQKQSKQKNVQKIQQISKMHKQITYKLQQKIYLLQKGNKQKKQKIIQLKYEIQRLYQSLKIQVQKQYKNIQKIKQLTQKLNQILQSNKLNQNQKNKIKQEKIIIQQSLKTYQFNLHQQNKKYKILQENNKKIINFTLPKIKQQIKSFGLICQHIISMIKLQKQQIQFTIQKKQQHFNRLIQQLLLSRSLDKQHTSLNNINHINEINKWKQNCKIYQQKYDKLKYNYQQFQQKSKKQKILLQQQNQYIKQKIYILQQENNNKKYQNINTHKSIQKLKQKCKEVQQYYKLVDDLSKQNNILKNKLENISYYSFKSPQKNQLDHTSKRQKFTSQQQLYKYNKNINQSKNNININDLTAKAQYQRLRLEAAKRQYNMINKIDRQ